MIKKVELPLRPEELEDHDLIRRKAIKKAGIKPDRVKDFRVVRRSIDARQRQIYFRLQVELYLHQLPAPTLPLLSKLQLVHDAPAVIIIGAGPAGYFAALEMIELGLRPIIFDRGKDVRARRRDLKAIQQSGIVNPHSNYCYGEGGAGTYSDGKLYTRSHKRGNIEKALQLLVEHGATEDILVDAHPHIGSNKLPKIVGNIRETILKYGGSIHFESFVTDLIIKDGVACGVVVNEETQHLAAGVVLATGHSARDIYHLFQRKGILMELKSFALGVRVEHPQPLIDQIQYKTQKKSDALPAASYRLACQVEGRGVFSFCMCPGGLVVPAATAPGELVVNGMSMSRRDSPFANSGTVVAVEEEDLAPYSEHGILAGLAFQRAVEQKLFAYGDGSQRAPAQRMTDFVNGKKSTTLPPTSYIPGLYSAPLHELLPKGIYRRLRKGMMEFGKKMPGYLIEDANVIGTESRTSSPVRIPRDKVSYQHPEINGLFPCGEGAGYAGGIISAAMDGQNVARAVSRFLNDE